MNGRQATMSRAKTVQGDRKWGRTILTILGLPALTVAALWIPFGFSLGGLVEEWDVLFLFTQHGVFYIADGASPLQMHKARPLTVLPQAVAYTLDPNSFFYWHIILATTLVVKGACAGIIGMYLTGSCALAALLALLTLLYPADTMQLSLRSLHINCAVALALVASVLIIFATRIEACRPRITAAALASITLGMALLMYEVVVGLAALPFLVVFARQGQGAIREIRKKFDVFAIWMFATIVWLAFFILAIRTGTTYHLAVLSDANLNSIVQRLGVLASSGLYRAFYECWDDLLWTMLRTLSSFGYPSCFTVIVMTALLWLANGPFEPTRSLGKRLAVRITTAGLIAFLLAYAPYLSDDAHLQITQRTFLAAAPGAALGLFGTFVFLSTVLDRRVVAALSALLIGGCFVAQLYQFDKYNRIYATTTRPLLSAIIPFISDSADRPYSVLLNDYGSLSGTWDLGLELQLALAYALPGVRAAYIFVCETRSGRLLPRSAGPIAGRGYCKRTEDGIALAYPGDKAVLLKDAAVAKLSVDGVVSVEGLESNPSNNTLPSRVLQLFALSKWRPADSMFRRQERTDRFECRFESMWGYASPCRTFGFFDGVPYRTALGSSYAWIGETNAGLIFDINPRQGDYQLVVEILNSVSPLRALEVSLNGVRLATKLRDATRMEAIFPSRLLRRKNNTIELGSQLDDKLGLSFAVERISINPTRQ